VRSVFVEYRSEVGVEQDRNHRQTFERLVYEDDGGIFKDTTFSDFDGLGHHRRQTLSGTFGSGGNSRVTTTLWNLEAGTYPGSFVMPARDAPWQAAVVTEQSTSEGGVTAKTELCTDRSTGFVSRRRVLANGTTRQANDLLSVLTPNASGFVASEALYGGDAENAMDSVYGELCAMALPDADPGVQFKMLHT